MCPNGREALAALAIRTPDLVILDLRMPEMDGITFLEVIRCYLRGLPADDRPDGIPPGPQPSGPRPSVPSASSTRPAISSMSFWMQSMNSRVTRGRHRLRFANWLLCKPREAAHFSLAAALSSSGMNWSCPLSSSSLILR